MEELRGEGDGGLVAAVEVSRDDAGTLIIRLSGDLDISTIDVLGAEMAAALDDAPDGVVFELAGVTFFDSSGLTALLEANAKVGSVVLRRPSEVVRRVIDLSGLTGVLEVEP
ncbi:MAG: anti-anti-sigma factor [Acidimicrobiales bacterium]|nr:anti-anti-sigma factor [Acidimicrobiales bacterium]